MDARRVLLNSHRVEVYHTDGRNPEDPMVFWVAYRDWYRSAEQVVGVFGNVVPGLTTDELEATPRIEVEGEIDAFRNELVLVPPVSAGRRLFKRIPLVVPKGWRATFEKIVNEEFLAAGEDESWRTIFERVGERVWRELAKLNR